MSEYINIHILSSALRLVFYHMRKSIRPYPIIQNPENSFVEMFQDFRQRYTSSGMTADARPLLKELVKHYIPHKTYDNVYNNYQDADLFFESLVGHTQPTATRPRIPRCTALERIQLLVQTKTTFGTCCGGHQEQVADRVDWQAFVSVTLTDNNTSSLAELVQEYFQNGQSAMIRCSACGRQIHKTVTDQIVRTPEAILVYVYYIPTSQLVTSYNAHVPRPEIDIVDNIIVDIVEDGEVEFELIGSCQHYGSRHSGRKCFIVLLETFSNLTSVFYRPLGIQIFALANPESKYFDLSSKNCNQTLI